MLISVSYVIAKLENSAGSPAGKYMPSLSDRPAALEELIQIPAGSADEDTEEERESALPTLVWKVKGRAGTPQAELAQRTGGMEFVRPRC